MIDSLSLSLELVCGCGTRSTMSSVLYLKLLGVASVEACGRTLRLPRKSLGVLAFLSRAEGNIALRRVVAELLWPRQTKGSSLHSLSQSLYMCHRAGLGRFIEPDREHVRLIHFKSDVDRFTRAAATGDARTAGDLWRGALLSDHGIASDRFDDWVHTERLKLFDVAHGVLRGLVEDFHLPLAEALARSLLLIDPLDPDVNELLVRILTLMGRPTEAARLRGHFDAGAEGLSMAEPLIEDGTTAYSVDSGATPLTAPNRFVGRAVEMELLRGELAASWRGQGRQLTIVGEAGIGKTALAQRAQRLAVLRGGRCLWAQGYPLEKVVPYGVVIQWIRNIETTAIATLEVSDQRELVASFPFLRESLPVEPALASDRTGLLDVLLRLFLRLMDKRPLMLILDDEQWADEASKGFVHFLCRNLPKAPLTLLTTRRGSLPSGQETAPSSHPRVVLSLAPLSREETAGLAEALGYAGDFSALYDRTGGIPLLILALVCNAVEDGGLDPAVTPTVFGFVRPQVESLSEESQLTLAAMAVLPPNPSVSELAAVAGITDRQVEVTLVELQRKNLLLGSPQLRPTHFLLAEVALASLPAASERALRGRAAGELSRVRAVSPAALAPQFDIAGQRDNAYRTAMAAARASAELLAHKEAEFFCRIALSNARNHFEEASVRMLLSDALAASGRSREAAQVLELTAEVRDRLPVNIVSAVESRQAIVRLQIRPDAISLADAWEVLEARGEILTLEDQLRLARGIAATGHDLGFRADTMKAGHFVLGLLANLQDARLRVAAGIQASCVIGFYSSYEEGLAGLERFQVEAAEWFDTHSLWLTYHGSLLVAAGHLGSAEDELLRALEISERSPSYQHLYAANNNLAVCYQEQGRFEEAVRLHDRGRRLAERGLAISNAAISIDNLAVTMYELGDYSKAVLYASERVGDSSPRSLVCRRSIAGLAALESGQLSEAFDAYRELDHSRGGVEFGNDVSYAVIFLARMDSLLHGAPAGVRRLSAAAEAYRSRDILCAARMDVERLRLLSREQPQLVYEESLQMIRSLANSGARPIISKLEQLRDRLRVGT